MQRRDDLIASAHTSAVVATALTRRFGAVWAVRDVTFALPPRSVLLVVGPNGSGKTTLLRLLATALRPTSGAVAVFGHDAVHDADAVRRLSAFVGTAPGVYDPLTARENLQFAAAMCGRPREPVPSWLERVGLTGTADQPVRTFSQGMKRRLALARAWLAAPAVLLLDEPYGGLDAGGVHLVDEMVAETTRRGGSAIVATHEWERGARVADTVLALAGGRPVEVAPAGRLSDAALAAAAGGLR